ncbi:MAG: DUF4175 family protein, partial [Planctomycetota bacterium]
MSFQSPSAIADRQLERIRHEVDVVLRRSRAVQFWKLVGVLGFATLGIGLMLRGAADNGMIGWPILVATVICGFVSAITLAFLISRSRNCSAESAANRIESRYPDLKQRLVTAEGLSDEETRGPLARRLIRETHDHFRAHEWSGAVSSSSLLASRSIAIVACSLALTLPLLRWIGGDAAADATAAGLLTTTSRDVTVLPGDTSIERGTSLVVTAEFSDLLPEATKLQCETGDGRIREVVMKRNLNDPIFGGFLARVEEPMTYRVLTEDWTSPTYSIDVFEFPEVLRSDAILDFPGYTEMEARTVEDTVKVSVVEGTEVTWRLNLNKPVETCTLQAEDLSILECENADVLLSGRVAAAYEAKLVADETVTYEVKLRDDEGRENKYPLRLTIKVIPNRPPKLKLEKARDVTVSALQELPLRASVNDDFGVRRAGLSYSLEMQAEQEVELATSVARGAAARLDHRLEIELV